MSAVSNKPQTPRVETITSKPPEAGDKSAVTTQVAIAALKVDEGRDKEKSTSLIGKIKLIPPADGYGTYWGV